jgi:hypothetical protein
MLVLLLQPCITKQNTSTFHFILLKVKINATHNSNVYKVVHLGSKAQNNDIQKGSHFGFWPSPTSSRCTRKVTLVCRSAVSLPSLVERERPFGALLGHICFLCVYMSLTPLTQLLDTTFRYLKKISYD